MYSFIRISIITAAALVLLLLHKRKYHMIKKGYAVTLIIVSIVFCAASQYVPVENLVLTFNSPEEVFNYTTSGRIVDITSGDNSCMVYYSTGNSTYSYKFIGINDNGYCIATDIDVSDVFSTMNANGIFEVKRVRGTDDYYLLAAISPTASDISFYDSSGNLLNVQIMQVGDSGLIHFGFTGFEAGCCLMIDGERVILGT